jgi:hypothetical protein
VEARRVAVKSKLIVMCGSLCDGFRLLSAALPDRRAEHCVVIPRPDPSRTGEELDAEWRRWIDCADEVLAVRKPDGSIGDAVTAEVAYAREVGCPVRWWPDSDVGDVSATAVEQDWTCTDRTHVHEICDQCGGHDVCPTCELDLGDCPPKPYRTCTDCATIYVTEQDLIDADFEIHQMRYAKGGTDTPPKPRVGDVIDVCPQCLHYL